MNDWHERLTTRLEPLLAQEDPRQAISAYHDMPYAIFRYPPEVEFELRRELALLRTRLEQAGKRVTTISLAELLWTAIEAESSVGDLVEAERRIGLEQAIDTVHEILSQYKRLDDIVVERMPTVPDPRRDVVLIVRAGALFPMYRTSSLLEQLKGRVEVPSVLFFPGELDGAAGLRFMGVLDAEHNYRPMIF
jgi:bacteriophage exclusion system BrxB-like protein